nr:hypothetical protein [Tanacetum cinerariifolium]
DEFIRTVDENIKEIIKEQVKEQVKAHVSKILPRIKQAINEQLKAERRRDDDEDKDEEPSAGPDWRSKRCREGKEPESVSDPSKTATKSTGRSLTGSRSQQASASESAFEEEPVQTTSQMEEPSHPEFDTELLAGPTYDLMKGSCKSLIELEYHLEEVYKAITDQLDWVNPEGQQYLHNLLQPLPLIPDNRGRRVILFAHFINNDLEYLRGVSHWGRKRQQFYGFAVNRESARDVYSTRRIIAVMELKIVEWHSYKHLDWITEDYEELGKFCWRKAVRGRLQDATQDHMIYRMLLLSFKRSISYNSIL